MTLQLSDMKSSSNVFKVAVFLLSCLVTSKFPVNIKTGSGVIKIFVYKVLTRNPETGNSPVSLPSDFSAISGDCGKLGTPNLAKMYLIKCYSMLQNARITTFTVSELLRKNQQRSRGG